MRRQPAAYPGKLATVPENAHIKSVDDLKKLGDGKFVQARVLFVDDGKVELVLISS